MVEFRDSVYVRACPRLRATEITFVMRDASGELRWGRRVWIPWIELDQARFPELVFGEYLDAEIDGMLYGSL
ncbi:MAG: hypothetical protein KGL39_22615 [Patescibacteria group bacterium]|nr:hypothetical protein [Patescibacteria group bacterium]